MAQAYDRFHDTPFSRATREPVQSVSRGEVVRPGPTPYRSPAASGGLTTSRGGYNPMTDPEGPLARAGWIGALVFGHGKSRSEHLIDMEQAQKQQIGQARGKAFQLLGTLVEQGNSPQKAFLEFLQTPEGQDFIVHDPNPQEALQSFMKLASGDPAAQLRAQVFGESPFTPQSMPNLQSGQTPSPSDNKQIVEQQVNPHAAPLKQLTPQQLLEKAQILAAAGDDEGSRLAIEMAKQYDTLSKGPSTDELDEYNKYEQQEAAAGRKPMSWLEYKLLVSKATNPAGDARQKAVTDLDLAAAKEAQEVSGQIAKALPVLGEIERIADDIPGGWAGVAAKHAARFASTFGMEVPDNWSAAETFDALTMQLFPLVRQPGQVSNYEQQTYRDALPNLLQSKEGRKKVAATMRKMGERAIEVNAIYRKYIGTDELPAKLAEAQAKPLFSPEEIQAFEAAKDQPAPTPKGGAEAGGRVQIKTAAEWQKLAPGTPYIDPNGNPKIKGGNPQGTDPKAPAPKTRTGGTY